MKKRFSRTAYLNQKNRPTFEIDLPSGATFELVKPDIQAYLVSGQLPSSYIEKMVGSQGKSISYVQSVMDDLTPPEKVANMLFMGTVVKKACVNPKIVVNPQKDNEISFDELHDDDVLFIFRWATNQTQGGVEGENISKFRPQSNGNASISNPDEADGATSIGAVAS